MLRLATQVPNLITPLPGPRAAALIARDEAVLSPSYTPLYPLVIERGEGCTVEDVDGNLFLDFTAGIAVTATGHSHPAVVAAIAEQAGQFLHMSGTDFYYEAEIELAERLAELAPGKEPKRVFFCNSGAEAVEAALKLARHHTGRQRAIAFYGAFHGRTYGALSLSGSKSIHQQGFGPLLPGVHRLPFNCSRAEFENLFATACPADEVAAIFVEPIQGEGGYRLSEPHFLPLLREICDRHGILLVFDEIQSGIGRTGKMLASEHFGVVPDMICLAKGIASGLPLGAMIARADVMDWPPGSHASTFGGNPVSCRAALATLDLVEVEYMANAASRGEQLLDGLHDLATQFPFLANPRGLGLMVAVDVTGEPSPAERGPGEGLVVALDPTRRDRLIQSCFERGLLLLPCGRSALRFCPALCVTANEVETALSILRAVLNSGETS